MRRTVFGLGTTALLVAATCGGYRGLDYLRTWTSTDNAYLSGHVHSVSARIAGTVSEVLVEDNQEVQAGAVLARLDGSDLDVQRSKSAAVLAQAEAQLAQAQAQVLQNTALAGKARQDFDRADNLFHGKDSVISKQEFDAAKASLDAASAAVNASQAMVRSADAQRSSAVAQLKDVELQLSYTEIKAPAAGRIGRKNLELGNRVQPGQALLAIVEPQVWVTANFKETQLDHLRPGQKATVEVDSFPAHLFAGTIESLAPASGAQFALLPPDNATGNFTRIVQRVPVKVVFDADSAREFSGRLVPGMSARVKVKVRE
jgi:membrane fusion protein, multidrug efflux system